MDRAMSPLKSKHPGQGKSAAFCAMAFGVSATLAYYAMVDAPVAQRSACLMAAAALLFMAGWSGTRAVLRTASL